MSLDPIGSIPAGNDFCNLVSLRHWGTGFRLGFDWFTRSRALSRRGDLRLCRSIPIGSIDWFAPPLINALALSRLSVSAPAGRIPVGNEFGNHVSVG